HLVGGGVLLFHRRGNSARNSVDLVDHCADRRNGIDRRFGVGLNGFDFLTDVLGGLGRLLGQFLHFVGHDGKAFAGFSRARRFDGGVQGEQVGLLRDRSNDLDDLTNLVGGLTQFGDGRGRGFGDLDGGGGDSGGFGRVLGNLPDTDTHLFRTRGDGLQVLADLLGRAGYNIGLRRRFLRVGSDLFAGHGQRIAGASGSLGGLGNLRQHAVHFFNKQIQTFPQLANFVAAFLVDPCRKVVGFRHGTEFRGERVQRASNAQ